MSDSIPSDELLKSLTDRILRLREEEDALKADIREVYGEAKAQGFDKTILGKVVARIRAEAKDGDKLSEQEQLVDLYLNAYRGASRAHTHAGAREKAPAKVETPHHPETGEVIEPVASVVEKPAAPASVEPFSPPAFLSGERKPLRPHCQRPENCSGYGRNHCHECGKAADAEAA